MGQLTQLLKKPTNIKKINKQEKSKQLKSQNDIQNNIQNNKNSPHVFTTRYHW